MIFSTVKWHTRGQLSSRHVTAGLLLPSETIVKADSLVCNGVDGCASMRFYFADDKVTC